MYEQYGFIKDCYRTSVATVWIDRAYHPGPRECIKAFMNYVDCPIVDMSASKADMPGICLGSFKEHPAWPAYNVKDLSSYIESTQLLLLDVDEIPVTLDKIQEYLDVQLNCWNLWYTTPRSTVLHPRVRVLIATSKPITMLEKKALCKPLTQMLPGVDKASFEASKFCLLPCLCKDSLEPDSYSRGISSCSTKLDIDSLKLSLEPKQVMHFKTPKLANDSVLENKLSELIDEINSAPNGHSREVMKPRLSKLFREHNVNMELLEDMANDIDRYDRRRDFTGIAKWLSNQSL